MPKYYIITYGCQMNKSDSERIASLLEKVGYNPIKADSSAEALAKADLIVVNMCSVRQSAVDRIYGLFPKFKKFKEKKSKLKTILTGCILKEDKKKFQKFFDLILDIKSLKKWQEIIKGKVLKTSFQHLSCDYLQIPPTHKTKSVAFVPISSGCNNACSYCVVPLTRGPLVSRPYNGILKEVTKLAKLGFKEMWLLGQNVNDYKFKTKKGKGVVNFVDLIKAVDKIPGNFKFFFVSPHPKDFSDKLIKTLAQSKKFGKYLNLPVQSGDNIVLKKMRRNYTVEEYKKLFKKIKKYMPDIKISTDVIVGFPTETEKQFQNTAKLFEELKFDNAYIAKYSPRPGTTASKLKDDIPPQEKRRRFRILNKILQNAKTN